MTLRRSPDGLWQSPLLLSQVWLSHSFGTALAAPGDGYLVLHQVHGTRLVDASEWNPQLSADALATPQPGTRIAVKTADCVPILLADPVRHVVAAVHAGWRGTASGIASHSVSTLEQRYGCRPRDLLATFGPSIGPCCFEVDPDAGLCFQAIFPERSDLHQRTTIDLREANRRLLVQAGLAAENIATDAPCTCCGGAEFYSWRRDRVKGQRMFSAIEIRPDIQPQ
ncbi:MAG TPA: peptidoglycan editing factor PgeF [Bryobacteraceae bacterium]|nr:peptidoglycan editing factor PgeF [Bryobacteraceae bacterium]